MENSRDQILKTFEAKAGMKQTVFKNTFETIALLKEVLQELTKEYNEKLNVKN